MTAINKLALKHELWRRNLIHYKFHSVQKELWELYNNSPEGSTLVWLLSRQTGKSFCLGLFAVIQAQTKPNSIIKIVSTKYELSNSKPDDMMVSKCKEWSLSDKSIISIFRHGKPISMHDFHYMYYVLPCEVKGSVQIDSNIYKYRINAGSFFTISTGLLSANKVQKKGTFASI